MENLPADEQWTLGDEILVRSKGIRYPAKVIQVELDEAFRTTYTVHYMGYKKRFDEKFTAEEAKEVFSKMEENFHDDPSKNLFEVEAILDWRLRQSREFLIQWQNYGSEHNSWQPEENLLVDSVVQQMLDSFLAERQLPSSNEFMRQQSAALAAKKKSMVRSNLSKQNPSIRKLAKRIRPMSPARLTSSSEASAEEPPKKYLKKYKSGADQSGDEESHFCIVPFLEMDDEAKGRPIPVSSLTDLDSSRGFGTTIAQPFLIEKMKKRFTESSENPQHQFMNIWNQFILSNRVIGQESLYAVLENFINSFSKLLITKSKDAAMMLRFHLLLHLSTLVKNGAISSGQRFTLLKHLTELTKNMEGFNFRDSPANDASSTPEWELPSSNRGSGSQSKQPSHEVTTIFDDVTADSTDFGDLNSDAVNLIYSSTESSTEHHLFATENLQNRNKKQDGEEFSRVLNTQTSATTDNSNNVESDVVVPVAAQSTDQLPEITDVGTRSIQTDNKNKQPSATGEKAIFEASEKLEEPKKTLVDKAIQSETNDCNVSLPYHTECSEQGTQTQTPETFSELESVRMAFEDTDELDPAAQNETLHDAEENLTPPQPKVFYITEKTKMLELQELAKEMNVKFGAVGNEVMFYYDVYTLALEQDVRQETPFIIVRTRSRTFSAGPVYLWSPYDWNQFVLAVRGFLLSHFFQTPRSIRLQSAGRGHSDTSLEKPLVEFPDGELGADDFNNKFSLQNLLTNEAFEDIAQDLLIDYKTIKRGFSMSSPTHNLQIQFREYGVKKQAIHVQKFDGNNDLMDDISWMKLEYSQFLHAVRGHVTELFYGTPREPIFPGKDKEEENVGNNENIEMEKKN